MRLKQVFFPIMFLVFLATPLFADDLVDAFGVHYHVLYEDALAVLRDAGFTVTETSDSNEGNTRDVYVDAFHYDGMPYGVGMFAFEKEADGKYYFLEAVGVVNCPALIDVMERDDTFSWRRLFQSRYGKPQEEDDESASRILYKADNGGYVYIEITVPTESEIGYFMITVHPKGHY